MEAVKEEKMISLLKCGACDVCFAQSFKKGVKIYGLFCKYVPLIMLRNIISFFGRKKQISKDYCVYNLKTGFHETSLVVPPTSDETYCAIYKFSSE